MKKARDTILKKALGLFARKGYAGCSIREICQAAGITKPVLYYHFRSKEHLYQELMLEIFNQTQKNLLRLSKFSGSLRDRLILYVSSELRNCRKDPENVRLLFRMMFSPEGEYPYFNFVEEFKRERKVIAGLIREHGTEERASDPELVSTALMGMMLITILEYLFTGRKTLTRDTAERLVDLLLPSFIPSGNAIPLGIEGGR
jgi:TetR/AcrR family transcriptional regulator